MKITPFILLLCVYSTYAFVHKKPTCHVKVSVIIPCHFKHAYLLHPLLQLFERQTRLPDEVVISLSEANKVSRSIIATLENEEWLFPVKLLLSDERVNTALISS